MRKGLKRYMAVLLFVAAGCATQPPAAPGEPGVPRRVDWRGNLSPVPAQASPHVVALFTRRQGDRFVTFDLRARDPVLAAKVRELAAGRAPAVISGELSASGKRIIVDACRELAKPKRPDRSLAF